MQNDIPDSLYDNRTDFRWPIVKKNRYLIHNSDVNIFSERLASLDIGLIKKWNDVIKVEKIA